MATGDPPHEIRTPPPQFRGNPGDPGEAEELNERLIERLQESGALRDRAVTMAFRTVLRHRFLPGRPLDEVYEDAAIMTKMAGPGVAISSSSQPAIMAVMLQLLAPRPGDHVLEVGAGTGYNAALLAHLVAPTGSVVTLEIDQDLAEQAAANLAAAGVAGATVVRADGARGWPAGAPYDGIILTVAAQDLSPAWLAQLREGGRLVLPLGVGEGAQVCTVFVRRGRTLTGSPLSGCGFVPLRGEMAAPQAPASGQEPAALPGPARPTGRHVAGRPWHGFAMWLAVTEAGAIRTRPRPDDPPAIGLRDEHGLALLVGEDEDYEVTVYGDGDAVAERLLRAFGAWRRRQPRLDRLRLDAYPAGEEPPALHGLRVLRRDNFTFVVREVA